jgi:predicted metal-dependent hydrolase
MTAGSIFTGIKVRRPKFKFDKGFKKYYARDNIFMTHFTNTLHILFPEGEKFFIRSIMNFEDKFKDDETLKAAVKDFVGQEGVHQKLHRDFWKVMESQNIDAKGFREFYHATTWGMLEKWFYKTVGHNNASLFTLAVTSALEHFTATYGDTFFKKEDYLKESLPEDMYLLLGWHAAEEIEHKNVSYDVYQKVSGNYPVRAAAMLFSTFMLLIYAYGGTAYLTVTDKDLDIKRLPGDLYEFLFKFDMGLTELGFYKGWIKYFKPDFHPSQDDNFHFAVDFFNRHADFFGRDGVANA